MPLACWIALLAAGAPEGPPLLNIAPNPSFEIAGKTGLPAQWRPATGGGAADLARDREVARTGEHSVRIARVGTRAVWESPQIPVRPGDVLRFGAWVRGRGATGATRLELAWQRGGQEIGLAPGPPAAPEGDDWVPTAAAGRPPDGADAVRLRLVSTANRGAVWFDDAFLGIENPEVQILGSQAGFHPVGLKEFIVRSRLPLRDPYAILEGEDAEGRQVRKGLEVHPVPAHPWGFYNSIVDLTGFRRPGTYRVVVREGPGGEGGSAPREARSRTFRISDRVYRDLLRLAAGWFRTQRCGTAVPGWHAPCHTDDAALRRFGGRAHGEITGFIDARGGWHDAGDYNKWVHYGWIGVLALSEVARRLGPRWPDPPGPPLEEAAWEVRYLLKMARPDGSFSYSVEGWHPTRAGGKPGNNPWDFWGPPEMETDNRPRTGDERYVNPRWPSDPRKFCARTAWGLAAFAAAPGHRDPDLRGRALRAARRALAFALKGAPPEGEAADLWGAALGAACAIWRVTRDPEDQDLADDAVKEVLALGHPEGWFRTGPDDETPAVDYQFGFTFVAALADYAALYPDAPYARPARDALERFFASCDPALQASPFGQIAELKRSPDRRVLPPVWQGYNTYYACTAYAALRAAEATENPRFAYIAERQLHWILGANPLDVCMVVGAGARNPGTYHTRYATIPGHEDARQPGGVVNGINGGDGEAWALDAPILAFGKGLTGAWQTNEYWVPNQGWFILAVTEVEKALERRARIIREVEERQRRRREAMERGR